MFDGCNATGYPGGDDFDDGSRGLSLSSRQPKHGGLLTAWEEAGFMGRTMLCALESSPEGHDAL